MSYRPGLVVATLTIDISDGYGKQSPSQTVPLAYGTTDVAVASLMMDVAAGTTIGRCAITVGVSTDIPTGSISLNVAELDVVSDDGANQLSAYTITTPTLSPGSQTIHFDDPASGPTNGTDLSMTTGDDTRITSVAGGRYQFQFYAEIEYAR